MDPRNDPSGYVAYRVFRAATSSRRRPGAPRRGPGCGCGSLIVLALGIIALTVLVRLF